MTQRNVETVLGRLATDPDLLRRFERDARAVVRELEEQGYALTPIEFEAIVATDLTDVAALAARLDARIRRASAVDECTGAEPSRRDASTPQVQGDPQ